MLRWDLLRRAVLRGNLLSNGNHLLRQLLLLPWYHLLQPSHRLVLFGRDLADPRGSLGSAGRGMLPRREYVLRRRAHLLRRDGVLRTGQLL